MILILSQIINVRRYINSKWKSYPCRIVLSGFTELQKKYSPLNAEPTNYCKSLLRVYDNIWVEKGKAKSEPARVSGSSEEISNHKLVYSSVKITGQKGA